jgi:hypothetical protein
MEQKSNSAVKSTLKKRGKKGTVVKYLSKISLNKKQLAKLNKLRKEAGNEPITA